MQPFKPAMKSSHMQSVRPAMLQSIYRKHSYEECHVRPVSMCDDKKCQSTKSLCDDNSCKPTRCVHIQNPAMPQSNCKKVTQSTHL